MPKGRFAELNSEVDRAAFRRRRRRCLSKEQPVIGRNAMSRQPSNSRRKPARKARPVLEGLEDRQLLSGGHAVGAIDATSASGGTLSHHDHQFKYTTPTRGVAVIVLQGHGTLNHTFVDNAGLLHIEYADTNSFSKIFGQVYGGDGTAPLASIINRHLVEAKAQNSLSGVGGNALQAVILNDWNLVGGGTLDRDGVAQGTINLTSGVNSLVLNSIGANTQIHLRQLPAELQPTALPASPSNPSNSSSSSSASSASSRLSGSSSTGSSSSGVTPTLVVGVPTTITNPNGTKLTYVLNNKHDLTLTGVSGSFAAQPNLVEPLPTGQPAQTPPPAPPGVILKANTIKGNPAHPINLLTDSVIWGYDPTSGDLVPFLLDLANGTGVQYPGKPNYLPTIAVPGKPSVVGLNLGWDGNQLDVLVSSGTTVYAYNATSGAPDGYFSTATLLGTGQIISIGSTDTVTVLDSYGSNSLQMIDLAASLASTDHMAVAAAGSPAAFNPPAGFTFLGGLTSVPGSTTVYGTVAAHFNTFQPDKFQLGIQSANTVKVKHDKKNGSKLTYKFSSGSSNAVMLAHTYLNVDDKPLNTGQAGTALGSVDSNLALGIPPASTPGLNTIALLDPSTGSPVAAINLLSPTVANPTAPFPDQLVALSGTFRPDLTGSALIDIQGDVQSIRGGSATGMILNDSGNLNLVKFTSMSDSTIVGQPLGHVDVGARLGGVTMLTPSRTLANPGRNGVTVVSNLQQVGPLSFTGD
jgi:hypothetical protein